MFDIDGSVDPSLRQVIEKLPDPLAIRVNSTGGNYRVGMNVSEHLQARGNVSIEIVHAESAAAIIALSCGYRQMRKDSNLILHLGTLQLLGIHALNDEFDHQVLSFNDMVKWQIKWLKERFPSLVDSPEMAELTTDNGVEISAARALELGLIHEII